MPLPCPALHLELAEQVMGRGSERVMPRYPLVCERRAQVIAMVEEAATTRPALSAALATAA